MLIEQIFELRGPGPPGRVCIPITGCFHDETIIPKENIRLVCYLLLKYGLLFTAKILQKAMHLLPPTWAKSLTKFNPKMQDVKRVLDLNCKQKED